MEQQHGSEQPKPWHRLSGGETREAGEQARPIGFEFGSLKLISPDGTPWPEWVIARGIEAAEQEARPIDDRTAHYIAGFLGTAATPALRNLATTGAVALVRVQEEITSLLFDQTQQVQVWINWLGSYCLSRAEPGPVEGWRADIQGQDRADAERLRRERLLPLAEDLFESLPLEEADATGGRDLVAIVRYIDNLGGLILRRRAAGGREVWASDSETELAERWAAIVERSPEPPEQGWILRVADNVEAVEAHPDLPDDRGIQG